MSKITPEKILQSAGVLFAKESMSQSSIRALAKHLGVSPSLIYYYFKNEDELFSSMFTYLSRQLGELRGKLPQPPTAEEMLRQRIEFQIDQQATIVAVLKYYLRFRQKFSRSKTGFLPDTSSLHVEEVLRFGVQTGEFSSRNIAADAKVITHAINGYLLEYYPHLPVGKEKQKVTEEIYTFIIRALKTEV